MENTSSYSDRILDRLRSGEEQALAELFSQHRERLRRTVCFRLDRRLLGRVDPEDVLQEAYLSALTRLRHCQGDTSASLFIWLRMIVVQTMVDLHRRHLGAAMRDAGREAGVADGFGASTSGSLVASLVGSMTSPSHAAIRQENSCRLLEALEQMDRIDREVLALRHFEELTNSEVAETLGIAQKAASIRYVRALKRLKALLSQFPELLE